MREFEQKRTARKIMSSPIVLVILAVVLFFVARGTWSIYRKNSDSNTELSGALARLAKLTDRQATLAQSVAKLKTDSGVEEEIRDRFQVAKEGEHEIVIVDATSSSVSNPQPRASFLQKVWDFFTIR